MLPCFVEVQESCPSSPHPSRMLGWVARVSQIQDLKFVESKVRWGFCICSVSHLNSPSSSCSFRVSRQSFHKSGKSSCPSGNSHDPPEFAKFKLAVQVFKVRFTCVLGELSCLCRSSELPEFPSYHSEDKLPCFFFESIDVNQLSRRTEELKQLFLLTDQICYGVSLLYWGCSENFDPGHQPDNSPTILPIVMLITIFCIKWDKSLWCFSHP
jgi:hypothetical protein